MTEISTPRPARSYRSGDWFGIFGEHADVILHPDAKSRVAPIWEAVDGGADFDEVLDTLISEGLRTLPGFVLLGPTADGTRVVLRGAAVAWFSLADGSEVELEGASAGTWVERTLPEVRSVQLRLSTTGGEEDQRISDGLVRVSRVDAPAVSAPAASAPAAAAQPAEQPAEQQVEQPGQPAYGQQSWGREELSDPLADPIEDLDVAPADSPAYDDEVHSHTQVPGGEEFAPAGAPGAPGPAGAGDGVGGEQEGQDGQETMAMPQAYLEDPAEADDPVDAGQPADTGRPSGAYTYADSGSIPDSAGPPSAPAFGQSPAAPAAPVWGSSASGAPADSDHDGQTRTGEWDPDQFARQRPGIPGQPEDSGLTDRPVARLAFSYGDVIEIERPVLIGRAPEARRFTSSEQPRLVTVPSPNQEISSTHLEVRPGTGADHGAAVVTDMGSTNGTVLIQPGLEPEELQAGVGIALIPGAVIDLGDGVTFQVQHP